MLLENPIIVWSVLFSPLAYLLYNLFIFVLDVWKCGQAVEQFPGEPKHWLWGHLHLVSVYSMDVNFSLAFQCHVLMLSIHYFILVDSYFSLHLECVEY